MNRFKAIIEKIETEGSMSLVNLKVGKQEFCSIIIDNEETVDYLVPENKIDIIFKETEVIIDKNTSENISLRNRIAGTIQKVDKNRLLSRLEIKTDIGTIASIITTGSVERLNLSIGDKVHAMIKTNEIYLAND